MQEHGVFIDQGQGVANPLAVLLSAQLMLQHMGERAVSDKIERAIFDVLTEGKHVTRDLGGTAGTAEFTDAIIDKL